MGGNQVKGAFRIVAYNILILILKVFFLFLRREGLTFSMNSLTLLSQKNDDDNEKKKKKKKIDCYLLQL